MAHGLTYRKHYVDLLISHKQNDLTIKKIKENKYLQTILLPRLNLHPYVNGKILRGLIACLYILIGNYDVIHVFESVQFESNLPLILCMILNKKVVLDIDEEWQASLPYIKSKGLIHKYIYWCDVNLVKKFSHLVVTSDYLLQKYTRLGVPCVLKIINGTENTNRKKISQPNARKKFPIANSEKMILSIGNTFAGQRAILLYETFFELYKLDSSIKLYTNINLVKTLKENGYSKKVDSNVINNITNTGYLSNKQLALYLAATNLTLFVSGSENSEKACYPIRIGTYLSANKVIAINQVPTETFNSLKPYNCTISGSTAKDLALNIHNYFINICWQKKLQLNTYKAKKKLCWNNLAKQLNIFYQTL